MHSSTQASNTFLLKLDSEMSAAVDLTALKYVTVERYCDGRWSRSLTETHTDFNDRLAVAALVLLVYEHRTYGGVFSRCR